MLRPFLMPGPGDSAYAIAQSEPKDRDAVGNVPHVMAFLHESCEKGVERAPHPIACTTSDLSIARRCLACLAANLLDQLKYPPPSREAPAFRRWISSQDHFQLEAMRPCFCARST